MYKRQLLDTGTGAVLERYEYDAYGTVHVFDGSWNSRSASAYGNPYTFTGRRLDVLDAANLRQMYYRHRYYDPTLGRFVQRDPGGYNDSANLYEYLMSTPVMGLDPLGLVRVGYSSLLGAGGDPCKPQDPAPIVKKPLTQKEIDRAYEECRDTVDDEAEGCMWRAGVICGIGSCLAATPQVAPVCFGAYAAYCKLQKDYGIWWCKALRDWYENGQQGYPPRRPITVDPGIWPLPLPKEPDPPSEPPIWDDEFDKHWPIW